MEYQASSVVVQAVMPGPVRTEFFDTLGSVPFPDHMFMTADDLVGSALSALYKGEQICFPTLEDPTPWSAFEDARKGLLQAVTATSEAAPRCRGQTYSTP